MPFSAVGALWLLYFLGYNLSVGVWVGLIACSGSTRRPAYSCFSISTWPTTRRSGRDIYGSLADLQEAIIEGAVHRAAAEIHDRLYRGDRPSAHHVGDRDGCGRHETVATPVIGGLYTSFLLELLVYPAIPEVWRWDFGLKKKIGLPAQNAAVPSPD